MTLRQVVSGGQTGVDRAALDTALDLGIACCGWCPRGRRSEDGSIPDRYPLTETPSENYAVRTRWNVRDSDGTLIFTSGTPSGGTALTVSFADDAGKPWLVVDLLPISDIRDDPQATIAAISQPVDAVVEWIANHDIRVLNVAGPRESSFVGIYGICRKILDTAFRSIQAE